MISSDVQSVSIKGHDLCELATATEDEELVQIASRLQVILGFVGQLRYPDYLPYPKIPNEMYTNEQAVKAMELTRILLEVVTEKCFHDVDEMTTDLSRLSTKIAQRAEANAQEAQKKEEEAEFSDS